MLALFSTEFFSDRDFADACRGSEEGLKSDGGREDFNEVAGTRFTNTQLICDAKQQRGIRCDRLSAWVSGRHRWQGMQFNGEKGRTPKWHSEIFATNI